MTIPILGLTVLTAINTRYLQALYNELQDENNDNGSLLQIPYTPPFRGGQCLKNYAISIRTTRRDGSFDFGGGVLMGPIKGITTKRFPDAPIGSNQFSVGVENSQGQFLPVFTLDDADPDRLTNFVFNVIVPTSGVDDCGDPPDPNDSIGSPNNGKYTNNYSFDGDDYESDLRTGSPITNISGAAAAAKAALAGLAAIINGLTAAAAAAAAIGNIAGAIGDIAGAIGEVFGGFNEILEFLERLEKFLEDNTEEEKRKRRRIFRREYGIRRKDGYLMLTIPSDEDIELIQLDVNFVDIPITRGRQFGELSPNRFNPSLGRIMFVSASMGINSEYELRYPRNSINIPPNTIGVFFHFGLDNQNRAAISAVYQQLITEGDTSQ